MRTADECLAKASDFDRLAERCDEPGLKTEFLDLARNWRSIAFQAAWQDTFARN